MMNYKIVEQIKNIKRVIANDYGLVLSNTNEEILIDGQKILEKVDGSSVYDLNNGIIQIYDYEEGCYYFDFKSGSTIKKDFFVVQEVNDGFLLANTRKNRISRGVYESDIIKLSRNLNIESIILKRTKYNLRLHHKNVFLLEDKTNLLLYSVDNTSLLWQFDLSQFGEWELMSGDMRCYEVFLFLGVYESQLLVVCNSGTLLSIDIETGKLIHRWDTYPPVGQSYYNKFDTCMVLDQKKGEVVGFSHDVIWRVNLQTKDVTSYSLAEEFEKYGLEFKTNINSFPITDSHYYITANTKYIEKNDSRKQGIIALNKNTLQIDWCYIFDEKVWLGIYVPQVTETKLYQLDNNNNLYIFEKE